MFDSSTFKLLFLISSIPRNMPLLSKLIDSLGSRSPAVPGASDDGYAASKKECADGPASKEDGAANSNNLDYEDDEWEGEKEPEDVDKSSRTTTHAASSDGGGNLPERS